MQTVGLLICKSHVRTSIQKYDYDYDNIDFLQEGEVEQALLEENETVLNTEKG